jgi:hypothetical protein
VNTVMDMHGSYKSGKSDRRSPPERGLCHMEIVFLDNDNNLFQGCRNAGRQVSRATKFCTVVPCWFSVWNWRMEFRGGAYIF